NGDGSFSDVTAAAGIAAAEPSPYYDCWGASACDYNNDGFTDIFVSTYRLAPDLLYRNNGNGTFTEVGASTGVRGVATDAPQYFGHGMGSDWGDFDNDGLSDLVVGNLGHPDWRGGVSNPSLIFHNDNTIRFTEMHHDMGLKFREMNAGVTWADLDCDGWLDVWQSQYSYSKEGEGGEPGRYSRVYMNGGAPDFTLLDRTWHFGCKVHGAWTVSRLDFDNDGDIDLLVASQHEGVKLFRNDLPRNGRWLAMRLSGSPADGVPMNAFGTRVVVHADGRMFTRTLSTSSAGSRTATNSTELHFGLGSAVAIDSVVIHYPNGAILRLTTLSPDKRYAVAYNGQVSTGLENVPTVPDWEITGAQAYGGTLRFNIQSERSLANVRLNLFNAIGRRVYGIAAGELRPGLQSLSLPVRLSSGLHVMTLQSGPETRTIRIMVTH
ncbi:MAG: CRTAC1 family protein, partial [Bacteroidota bacterium]